MKKIINVKLSDELHHRLKLVALTKRVTIQEIAEEAMVGIVNYYEGKSVQAASPPPPVSHLTASGSDINDVRVPQ